MNKKIKYNNVPASIEVSSLKIVDEKSIDLPSPEEIAKSILPQAQKVTIMLDARSVDFFKKQAAKYNVKYQSMIREVLLRYTKQNA